MDQQVQHPVVTRGRILLLALLAGLTWALLSIFAGATSAVADDNDDGLLGSLTATVGDVTEPLSEVIAPATKPVTYTVASVTEAAAPVVETVTPAVEPLAPVTEPLVQVAEEVLEPVLDQPVIDGIVTVVIELVNGSVDADAGVDTIDPLTSAETPEWAASAFIPGPAAVQVTVAPSDTRAANVPAAGSLSTPQAPEIPESPTAPAAPAPVPAVGQTAGAPALVAALTHAEGCLTLAVASAASADFALPSSPTFDNDSSPG